MKKFLLFLLLSLLIVFISTTIFLSTIGYETNKFNNFLEQKLSRNIPYLKIKLENIKVKLDLKKVTFFITTPNPDIKFYGSQIKFKKINAYINFKSLLINEPKIDSVYIVSKNIDIKQAKDFVKYIKPSNSKKFFLNNINKGNFNFNLQFTFKDNKIKNYELDGFVKDFEANFKSYVFKDGSFVYNIGKNSGEMQNIRGNLSNIIINSGFIKYDITNSLEISGALDSEAKLNESQTERLLSKDMKKEIKVDNFMGKISSVFDIKFDKTLKLKDYNFKATGNLKNLLINFKKPKKIAFIDEVLEVLNFEKSNFTVDFSKKNNLSLDISGMPFSGQYLRLSFRGNFGEELGGNYGKMQLSAVQFYGWESIDMSVGLHEETRNRDELVIIPVTL